MQHWTLPADHSAERLARDAITEALRGDGVDPQEVEDVVLATSELVSNAVDHGQPPIHLELETRARQVRVTVRDSGTGQPSPRVAAEGAARGRGLSIVARLATDWGWERQDGRLHVWAEFRTGGAAGDS